MRHEFHAPSFANVDLLEDDVFAEFEHEDAAAGELIGCIDRMCAEVSDNPELLDDIRWELDLMKIRLGSRYVH